MERNTLDIGKSKKLGKPTEREETTAQWFLRGSQLGLSFNAIFLLEVGELMDLLIEKQNDSYEYAYLATQEDINREFGG